VGRDLVGTCIVVCHPERTYYRLSMLVSACAYYVCICGWCARCVFTFVRLRRLGEKNCLLVPRTGEAQSTVCLDVLIGWSDYVYCFGVHMVLVAGLVHVSSSCRRLLWFYDCVLLFASGTLSCPWSGADPCVTCNLLLVTLSRHS
jgi:hypothetical protein